MSAQYICRTAIDNACDHAIYSIKRIPHTDRLLTGSLDTTVRIWNTKTVQCDHVLKGHTLGVTCVDSDGAGNKAVSTSIDSTLKIWNIAEGTLETSVQLKPAQAWTAAWSPSSSIIAASSITGHVNLFNADELSDKPMRSLASKGKFGMTVKWSQDGRYIALGTEGGSVHLYDAETGSLMHTYSSHAGMPVRAISFMGSTDSPLIVTGSDDKRINVHDVRHSNHVAQLSGHTGWVLSVACNAGPYLAGTGSGGGDSTGLILSGSTDRKAKLWDLGTRRCISTMDEAQDQVWAVEWLESNERGIAPFVTAGEDASIRIYRAGGT